MERHYKEIANDIYGFRIGKNIIFYRETNSKGVEILRILHEQMDLKNRMGE